MNAICRTLLAAAVCIGFTTPARAAPPPMDAPHVVDLRESAAETASAEQRTPAVPEAATTITYRPPLRGAPSRRVIAGTRGGTSQ